MNVTYTSDEVTTSYVNELKQCSRRELTEAMESVIMDCIEYATANNKDLSRELTAYSDALHMLYLARDPYIRVEVK